MLGINKVILVGPVMMEPEIRQLNNGTMMATFKIVTNKKYKDDNGNTIEHSEWHSCVAFGKVAEIINKYVVKGTIVYCEGELKTTKIEKDGDTKYATSIKIHLLQMIGNIYDRKAAASNITNKEPSPMYEEPGEEEPLPF